MRNHRSTGILSLIFVTVCSVSLAQGIMMGTISPSMDYPAGTLSAPEPRETAPHANLFAAVARNDLQGVRALLARGTGVDARDEYSQTALMAAAAAGHRAIVQMLLDQGADVDAAAFLDGHFLTGHFQLRAFLASSAPLYCASALTFASENNHPDVVRALLAKRTDKTLRAFGPEALRRAAEHGHIEILNLLVHAGVNVEAPMSSLPEGERDGWTTTLMFAAYAGQAKAVKALLALGANVNAQDGRARTALIYAIRSNHLDIVRILLAHGAQINPTPRFTGFGESDALITAAAWGRSEIVRALLDSGADPNAQTEDGWSALITAVSCGHPETVEMLLARGADVNARNSQGQTPLLLALRGDGGYTALSVAAERRDIEIVRRLVARGADVNARTMQGWTPLMLAANYGATDNVRFLLAHGADIWARNDQGCTALKLALDHPPLEIVLMLKNAGATE